MTFDVINKITHDLMTNTLIIPIKSREKSFRLLEEQEKAKYPFTVDIKQNRPRRSLNANGYAWELITQIAESIGVSKDEIYIEMLKQYGQQGTVSMVESESAKYERSQQYFDRIGESELNGKTFYHYKFYIGSSQYDTKEMSILIDGIVYEAKELGIETLTPQELSRLKEEWHK